MDERTQEEVEWETEYNKHHDQLLKSIGELEAVHRSARQDNERGQPPWTSPGVINWIKSLVQEDLKLWEDFRTIRRRLISSEKLGNKLTDEKSASIATNAKFTEFLEKFQKWMDRYGPMLESEYLQWEKVKG